MTGIDYLSTSLKKLSVATAGIVVASIGVIGLWVITELRIVPLNLLALVLEQIAD